MLTCCFACVTLGEIRLTDATGQEVVLDQPAQRIISLAPHITESVFAIGAGSKLIGVVEHSDFPQAAQLIPQVGSYKVVNMEQVAALAPDLILAFGSGNGWELINRLRALGFTVYVDEPRSLEDIATSLRNFAVLAGVPEQGLREAERFEERYQALQKKYAQLEPVDVFYEVWNQPLITINSDHLISDIISLCGGRNIFEDAVTLVPKVSREAVIRRDPDVIIASGMGEERPEWLLEWLDWEGMTAVKREHLYFIPPDIIQRHAPRILEGAARMCDYLDEARSAVGENGLSRLN